MLRLGKWRYLITGAALALLFGLLCRGLSRILRPLTRWQRFSGTLLAAERQDTQALLTVAFTDSRRVRHTVAFPAALPAERMPQPGTPIRFAMDCALFVSGSYPQDAASAAEAQGKILLSDACRRLLVKEIVHEFAVQLLTWLAAALLCYAAVRLCFPAV